MIGRLKLWLSRALGLLDVVEQLQGELRTVTVALIEVGKVIHNRRSLGGMPMSTALPAQVSRIIDELELREGLLDEACRQLWELVGREGQTDANALEEIKGFLRKCSPPRLRGF